jgi:hypothetical protein
LSAGTSRAAICACCTWHNLAAAGLVLGWVVILACLLALACIVAFGAVLLQFYGSYLSTQS